MIQSWNLLDQSVYSDEILNSVAKIKKDARDKRSHHLSEITRKFTVRNYYGYRIAVGLFFLIVIFFVIQPEISSSIALIMISGTALLMILYFFYIDRVVYRVECSVILVAAVALVSQIRKDRKELIERNLKRVLVFILAISLILRLPIYYPDRYYKTDDISDYQYYISNIFLGSGDYKPQRYRVVVNKRTLYPNLIDLIKDNSDNYYLFDFTTTIQTTFYAHKPWERIPSNIYNHFTYFGGITTRLPDNQEMWKSKGIDSNNPFKSMVNSNIMLIDNMYSDIKLQYLQKYYYPNARKELVDIVDGFEIWKFYKD